MENNIVVTQQHIYPYPRRVSYSLEYQREHFWRCSYTSSISKAQHYKIVLPLYVKPVLLKPTAIQGLGLTMIGLYRTTEERLYLEVVVAYENLSNEINCSDWLYYKLDLMGEEVIDKREWVDESGGYSDVLTKKIYNNEIMISRFRVQKNYDVEEKRGVYLLTKATCNENNYTELNEDMLQSISWLSIEEPYNWKMTETLKSVNAENPSRIYFYYPSSWVVRRAEDPTGNLSRYVMSTNFNGDLLNTMNFYFMILDDDVTPQFVMNALFNRLRKEISSKSPVIKPVEKIFNAELESLSEAEVDIFDSDSLLTSQIKIYVGNIGELWFYFESISPPSTQYFYQWAVTKRALEIVLNSFNNSKMSLN